MNNFVQNIK